MLFSVENTHWNIGLCMAPVWRESG